jgi:hypothetical protein
MRNLAHPGASIGKALNDVSAAGRAKHTRHPFVAVKLAPHLLEPPSEALVELTAQQRVSDLASAAQSAGCVPVGQARLALLVPAEMERLDEVYMERLGRDPDREPGLHAYRARWAALMRSLAQMHPLPEGVLLKPGGGGGVEFAGPAWRGTYAWAFYEQLAAEQAAAELAGETTRLSAPAGVCDTFRRGVSIGADMALATGSLFLARPSMLTDTERDALWFGRVRRVLRHTPGPTACRASCWRCERVLARTVCMLFQ